MKLGLLADIHGDYVGLQQALAVLDAAGAEVLLCAGDMVDRGADADKVVELLLQRAAICIKGNHEHTVLEGLSRRRSGGRCEQLMSVGRIITDETAAYLQALPETADLALEDIRLLMAHGVPWSDLIGIFPDSRPALLHRLARAYTPVADVLILGHTHQPLCMRIGDLWVLNPGSVYGVTVRDSHTCGMLTLPELRFQVFDIRSSAEVTPYLLTSEPVPLTDE